MAEALSQSEIDALLNAYSTADAKGSELCAPQKQVRNYDFANPDNISKDSMRRLKPIYTKCGVGVAAMLASMLRLHVQIELLAIDQLSYREYCASLPGTSLFVEANLQPLSSNAIFVFDPLFVMPCVDLMAGAPQVSMSSVTSITEIDKAVIKPVLNLTLKSYADAWSSYQSLNPHLVSLTTDSTLRHVLLPSEPVLVCSYEVQISEINSMISICVPTSAIVAALPKTNLGDDNARHQSVEDKKMQRSLESIGVKCSAVLGNTSLSFGEVVNLSIGDVVPLRTKVDGEVGVWIENALAFVGTLGIHHKNLAVRITRPVAPHAKIQ